MYINKYMYSVGTQSGSLKIYVLYTVHVSHYCMYNKYNTILYLPGGNLLKRVRENKIFTKEKKEK